MCARVSQNTVTPCVSLPRWTHLRVVPSQSVSPGAFLSFPRIFKARCPFSSLCWCVTLAVGNHRASRSPRESLPPPPVPLRAPPGPRGTGEVTHFVCGVLPASVSIRAAGFRGVLTAPSAVARDRRALTFVQGSGSLAALRDPMPRRRRDPPGRSRRKQLWVVSCSLAGRCAL